MRRERTNLISSKDGQAKLKSRAGGAPGSSTLSLSRALMQGWAEGQVDIPVKDSKQLRFS